MISNLRLDLTLTVDYIFSPSYGSLKIAIIHDKPIFDRGIDMSNNGF